ncbi:unnamed protein product [Polarella glacialis]|uniref:Post-GPI attachment to proteins factor 3 n=1 Tax=Polarella glacialis TaxID=89957 RepID=A0A813D438_POLGL|nr:unnamed protein product [Polarella glacialis]
MTHVLAPYLSPSPWDAEIWGHYKDRDGWNEYCERSVEGAFLRQRIGATSNVFYLMAAWVPAFFAASDARGVQCSRNLLLAPGGPCASAIIAVAYCYLGMGSFLFHAGRTHRLQKLDVHGTYCALLVHVGLELGRFAWFAGASGRATRRVGGWTVAGSCVCMVALCAFAWSLVSEPKPFDPQFGLSGSIALMVLLHLLYFWVWPGRFRVRAASAQNGFPTGWFLLVSALLTVSVGFVFWKLDWGWESPAKPCAFDPNGWMQGHALWHFLTALALTLAYLFLRTERSETRTHMPIGYGLQQQIELGPIQVIGK